MPGGNRTAYAKWTEIGAGRAIEYRINGVILRDRDYNIVEKIPTGSFYAEVSVTNLSSETMDGKFLGVRLQALTAGNKNVLTFENMSGAAFARVFLLDKNCIPLCANGKTQ